MKIFDINDNEILSGSVDYVKGYLIDDKLFIAHHDAVQSVEEQGHYETVAEYLDENGEVYGSDVAWIVDVPAVEGSEAWDEYEDILRFIEYTEEELAEHEAQKRAAEQRQVRLEELIESGALKGDLRELYEALDMILNGVTE